MLFLHLMHYLGLYHYLALLSLLSYNILTAVVSFFMVSWGQIFTTSHLPLYYAFFYIVNQGKNSSKLPCMIWPGKNKFLQKAIIMVYGIRSMSIVKKNSSSVYECSSMKMIRLFLLTSSNSQLSTLVHNWGMLEKYSLFKDICYHGSGFAQA